MVTHNIRIYALLLLLVIVGACPSVLHGQVAPLSPAWVIDEPSISGVRMIDGGNKFFICSDARTLRVYDAASGAAVDTVVLDTTYQKILVSGDLTAVMGLNGSGGKVFIDRYRVGTWERIGSRIQFDFSVDLIPLISDSMLLAETPYYSGGKYHKQDAVLSWLNLNSGVVSTVSNNGDPSFGYEHSLVPSAQRIGVPAWFINNTPDGRNEAEAYRYLRIGDTPKDVQAIISDYHTSESHGYYFDDAFERVLSTNKLRRLSGSTAGVAVIPLDSQLTTSPLPSWNRFIRWFNDGRLFDVYDASKDSIVGEALAADTMVRVIHNPWNALLIFQTRLGRLYCYDLRSIDSSKPPPDCAFDGVADSVHLYEGLNPRFLGFPPLGTILRWYVNGELRATGKTPSMLMRDDGYVEVSCMLFADTVTTVPACITRDTIKVVSPDDLKYHGFLKSVASAVFAPDITKDIVVVTHKGVVAYRTDTASGKHLKETWTHPATAIAGTADDDVYIAASMELAPPVSEGRFMRLQELRNGIPTGKVDSVEFPDVHPDEYLRLISGRGWYHAVTGQTIWTVSFYYNDGSAVRDNTPQRTLLFVTKPSDQSVQQVVFSAFANQHETYVQGSHLFFKMAAYNEVNLNDLSVRTCKGLRTPSTHSCFPASNLFCSGGVLYEKGDSTWVLVDTIKFGSGMHAYTPASNHDISIVVMGFTPSRRSMNFGIFHKPTRRRTYESFGTLGDAFASAITNRGDFVAIGTNQKTLGIYAVPLNNTTSIYAETTRSSSPASQTLSRVALSALAQVVLPLGTRSVTVSDLRGRCVREETVGGGGTLSLDQLRLVPNIYLFTYLTESGFVRQVVMVTE